MKLLSLVATFAIIAASASQAYASSKKDIEEDEGDSKCGEEHKNSDDGIELIPTFEDDNDKNVPVITENEGILFNDFNCGIEYIKEMHWRVITMTEILKNEAKESTKIELFKLQEFGQKIANVILKREKNEKPSIVPLEKSMQKAENSNTKGLNAKQFKKHGNDSGTRFMENSDEFNCEQEERLLEKEERQCFEQVAKDIKKSLDGELKKLKEQYIRLVNDYQVSEEGIKKERLIIKRDIDFNRRLFVEEKLIEYVVYETTEQLLGGKLKLVDGREKLAHQKFLREKEELVEEKRLLEEKAERLFFPMELSFEEYTPLNGQFSANLTSQFKQLNI